MLASPHAPVLVGLRPPLPTPWLSRLEAALCCRLLSAAASPLRGSRRPCTQGLLSGGFVLDEASAEASSPRKSQSLPLLRRLVTFRDRVVVGVPGFACPSAGWRGTGARLHGGWRGSAAARILIHPLIAAGPPFLAGASPLGQLACPSLRLRV